ncbi:hypothetical protein [Streptomyces lydicus]|uniref:hypothetical protein n=1 Tax=Streptomyces lydicus TaxID=47763 RepID=UPI003429C32F
MSTRCPVTVDPPDDQGDRIVRIHEQDVGRAHGLWDMIVFLHRAGLYAGEEDDIATSDLIEWRSGGPNDWVCCPDRLVTRLSVLVNKARCGRPPASGYVLHVCLRGT